MLHVPKIAKNLLSISKFVDDNQVIFEFLSNICFVKDKKTKAILLEGEVKKGLYDFDLHFKTV